VRFPGSGWYVVKHTVLWEMRLTLFARCELARHIRAVASAKSATGIAGVLGNKGGLSINATFGCEQMRCEQR